MFDLDKEIRVWCRSIHSPGWNRSSSTDELEDHLNCEVGRFVEEGLSDREAFIAATGLLGKVEDLRQEHSKNTGRMSIITDVLLADFQTPVAEAGMSKAHTRPLLPTIVMSIGALVGGLLGAAVGTISQNETVTVASYVIGMVGGAIAGGTLGWRVHARRVSDTSPQSER